MKKLLKLTCSMASLLVVVGYACPSWAHELPQTMASTANIYSSYDVNCDTNDTAGAKLLITAKVNSGPSLSMKVEKQGCADNGCTISAPSNQQAVLQKGDGDYIVTLSKAAAGATQFTLVYHCETALGVHTDSGTSLKHIKLDAPIDGSTSGTADFEFPDFRDQVAEGTTAYTGLTTNYGCTDSSATEKMLPVIAQTMLFPNSDDSVAHKIAADGSETSISLNQLLQEFQDIETDYLPLAPELVQSRDVFAGQSELADGSGKVRGFQSFNGKLPPNIAGVTNFSITAPTFAANSCAKSLQVRVGVLNYCSKSQDASQKNRADVWIGDITSRLKDPGVMPNDFETAAFWPTLTINRDLANKPLDVNCGAGYSLAVEPSEADIDTYLPIKGYWPK